MTEGARNAVLTNIVVVSLALLLSCCTNNRETKALLLGTVGENPDSDDEKNDFACQQYGYYHGTKQFDDCMTVSCGWYWHQAFTFAIFF